MAKTHVTDLRHFLDERGCIADIPTPARKLANFLCSIVAGVTTDPHHTSSGVGVRCRRRPKRKPCPGEVAAILDLDSMNVLWECPVCGDNGVIYHWEGTFWDCLEDDDCRLPIA